MQFLEIPNPNMQSISVCGFLNTVWHPISVASDEMVWSTASGVLERGGERGEEWAITGTSVPTIIDQPLCGLRLFLMDKITNSLSDLCPQP